MKKKDQTTYSDILATLVELKVKYPSSNLGRHLSTALEDYGDLWGVSDKEILFALTKYKASMEMDVPHEIGDEEIDKIIQDGLNLSTILEEDQED